MPSILETKAPHKHMDDLTTTPSGSLEAKAAQLEQRILKLLDGPRTTLAKEKYNLACRQLIDTYTQMGDTISALIPRWRIEHAGAFFPQREHHSHIQYRAPAGYSDRQ